MRTPNAYPINAITQRPYSGINLPLLWAEARLQGFAMHERWSLIVTSPLQTLHRVQHELDPFSMPRKIPTVRSSDAKNMR